MPSGVMPGGSVTVSTSRPSVAVLPPPQSLGSVAAPVTTATTFGAATPRQGLPVSMSMPVVPAPAPITPPVVATVAPPAAPQLGATTEGLPDPRSIEQQRGQYMRSLDDQLKQGAEVLTKQLRQQQEYLLRMGDQQKRQFGLQVDQQIKHQELELVQQHNHQLLMLQQAAQQQKVALEQQANALLIEYNQKKANEDLTAQMFQFETAAQEAHRKYQEEIQNLQQHRAMGAQQLAAQGEALARQANISNMQAVAAQQVASRTSASLTMPLPTPMPTSYIPQAVVPTAVGVTPPASYLPPVQPGFALPSAPISTVPTVQAIPTTTATVLTPRGM